MSAKDNGGSAFPIGDMHGEGGMSLRDYFAIRAPEPTKDLVDLHQRADMAKNPHNDSYKPPIRSVDEISAFLRYRYADAMLSERAK